MPGHRLKKNFRSQILQLIAGVEFVTCAVSDSASQLERELCEEESANDEAGLAGNRQSSSTAVHFSTARENVLQFHFLSADKTDVGIHTVESTQKSGEARTTHHLQSSLSGGSSVQKNEKYHDF